MSVSLPGAGFIEDLRMPVAGDSFTWYGQEPTAAKKWLVIHHSASSTAWDGYTIAASHTAPPRNWGGVGYHFVVRHDNHPKGAGVEYVGDLGTYRAHVDNANPGRVGICLIGDFTKHRPGKRQLELTRQLIDYLRDPKYSVLPSIKYFSQVTCHGQVPGQATACPGHATPDFKAWFDYLKGGAFPHHFYAPPQPAQAPPAPVVVQPTPEPGRGAVEPPEWVRTYEHNPSVQTIQRSGAVAIDVAASVATRSLVKAAEIPQGASVNIAGWFTNEGTRYARSVWSVNAGRWNGVPEQFFQPSGQLEVPEVPITVVVPERPQNTPVTDTPVMDGVLSPEEEKLQNEFEQFTPEVQSKVREWLEGVLALCLAPLLRLIGKKGL